MSLPKLTLDINKQQRFNPIKPVIVQGDKGQQLEVIILSNNQDVDLSGYTLKFEATKADSKIIDDDNQSHFIKSENKITYTLVDEAYQSAGVLTGYFRLIDSKGNKDSTPSFEIEVLAQAGSDLRSDNYVSLAQQINDTMLSYQSTLKELSDKAPADWQKQQEDFERRFKEFGNQLDQNATKLLTSTDDKFKAKSKEIADWFNSAQIDLQSRKTEWDTFKRQSQSDKTAQQNQFRSEFDSLKADYETKKANLLSDYKKEFDTQKKQLSDDLSNFKSQLKSQLDNTQSTINQLKNSDIPAISKKLDEIRADIDKIDLDSVKRKADDAYSMAQTANNSVSNKADKAELNTLSGKVDTKASQSDLNNLRRRVTTAESSIGSKMSTSLTYYNFQIDNKDLAMKNQAVSEAKAYTDSKSSLEILTEEQAQKMSDNKTAKLGTFYAMNSNGIQGLALGDVDGSFNEIMGYMVALPVGTVVTSGATKITTSKTSVKLPIDYKKVKNGLTFTFTNMSVTGDDVPRQTLPNAYNLTFYESNLAEMKMDDYPKTIKIPKKALYSGSSVFVKSKNDTSLYVGGSITSIMYPAKTGTTLFEFSAEGVTISSEFYQSRTYMILDNITTY